MLRLNSFSTFALGIRLMDAIRKTHKEFAIEPDITKLIGTDEILKSDFNADDFIKLEEEKTAKWQEYSKKWYLY